MIIPARATPQAALRDLHHPHVRVRRAAVTALADNDDLTDDTALGQQILGALRQALADDDEEVRLHAAVALGRRGDLSALDPLLQQAASDTSARARQGAVIGLAQLRDRRAVAALCSALEDASADVRFHAVAALGQQEATDAAPALRALLGDPDAEVRGNTAAALGDLGDRDSCDQLVPLLDDPDPGTALEAAVALSRLGDRRGTTHLTAQLGHRQRGLIAAERLFLSPDPAALDSLRHQAARRFGDPLARVWIAGALIKLGATELGWPIVQRALQSAKLPVRGLAQEVLDALDNDRATSTLRRPRP